jgi:hypothetical protein
MIVDAGCVYALLHACIQNCDVQSQWHRAIPFSFGLLNQKALKPPLLISRRGRGWWFPPRRSSEVPPISVHIKAHHTRQFPLANFLALPYQTKLSPPLLISRRGRGGFHLGARVRSLQSASTSRHTIQGNSHLPISWSCPTKPSYHLPSSYRGGDGDGGKSS